MARVPIDTNDGYVWLLSETSGLYLNSGNVLPGNPSTSLTVSGTVIRTGTGLFDGYAAYFPGAGNYPSGASSTRNYAAGAPLISPTAPFTLSCWVYLRGYQSGIYTNFVGKTYRDHTVTSSWTAPFWSIGIGMASTNGGQDVSFQFADTTSSRIIRLITDYPVPLHQWCHIGMTHSGTTIKGYLNGCELITYSGSVQQNSTAASAVIYNSPPGYWVVGAVPATGSASKEEPNYMVQDVRLANVVRTLDYFQEIYSLGALPINFSDLVRYYKLRAFDTSCPTPTAVTWIDTQVSLVNAPAFPCSGPYSSVEILDTWLA